MRRSTDRSAAMGMVDWIDMAVRRAFPTVSVLALIVIGAVPWPLPGAVSLWPVVPTVAVFLWAIRCPRDMPALAAFFLGVAQDVLSGAPLGLNALIVVVVQGAGALNSRWFGNTGFLFAWIGFAFVAAIAAAIKWLFASIYFVTPVVADPVIGQFATTVLVFPVLATLIGRRDPTREDENF